MVHRYCHRLLAAVLLLACGCLTEDPNARDEYVAGFHAGHNKALMPTPKVSKLATNSLPCSAKLVHAKLVALKSLQEVAQMENWWCRQNPSSLACERLKLGRSTVVRASSS